MKVCTRNVKIARHFLGAYMKVCIRNVKIVRCFLGA
jgi:hypothetical protein